jgi:polyisoprenoid-binding protein YceI
MRSLLPILLVSVGAPDGGAANGAATYRVVPDASDVYVHLRPDSSTLLSGMSHEHAIVARRFSGEIRWNPASPEDCWVEVEVPIDGLEVDPPEKREALGFDKGLSEGDRKKVEKNMRAKDQLWAEKYDSIRFRAAGCSALEEGVIEIRGALTVRGVSANVELPVNVEFDDDGLRARVEFSKLHADFGFNPYSNLLGALKNDERIDFHVDVRADRVE